MMWDHDGRALCLVTRALLGPHMLLPAAVAPWTWPWVHTGGSQLAAVHNGDGSGSMYASVYGMLGFDASAAEHELRLHLRSTVFARTSECVRAVAAHFAGAPPDARLRTVAQWRLWAAALHWQLGIVDRNARVMEYFLSVSPGQGQSQGQGQRQSEKHRQFAASQQHPLSEFLQTAALSFLLFVDSAMQMTVLIPSAATRVMW